MAISPEDLVCAMCAEGGGGPTVVELLDGTATCTECARSWLIDMGDEPLPKLPERGMWIVLVTSPWGKNVSEELQGCDIPGPFATEQEAEAFIGRLPEDLIEYAFIRRVEEPEATLREIIDQNSEED